MRVPTCLMLALGLALPSALRGQACGGTERWAVKVAADPEAGQIDLQHPVAATLDSLVRLPRPALPADEVTRLPPERSVRTILAHLVKFKEETGKTGDSDFHLVISDATLLYSPSGTNTQASPHSLVAEIPDPACVGGADGTVSGPSVVAARLAEVRSQFTQQFPNLKAGWNDAQGIPVRLTGVVFFDRPHGQVGRSLNGLELHPLLAIEFNPDTAGGGGPGVPAAAAVTLENPGFELGEQGWTASPGVITSSNKEAAHGGQWKAWLGGYGEAHTDRLSQRVSLPAGAHAISLTFFLHIDTEETGGQPYDRLVVRLRGAGGQVLANLATFSNQNAAPGFSLHSYNLTAYAGQAVRIEFVATEDSGSVTSFVIDDVAVVSEPE